MIYQYNQFFYIIFHEPETHRSSISNSLRLSLLFVKGYHTSEQVGTVQKYWLSQKYGMCSYFDIYNQIQRIS